MTTPLPLYPSGLEVVVSMVCRDFHLSFDSTFKIDNLFSVLNGYQKLPDDHNKTPEQEPMHQLIMTSSLGPTPENAGKGGAAANVTNESLEPYFNTSVLTDLYAPVGGKARIECVVGNLGEHAVSIFWIW